MDFLKKILCIFPFGRDIFEGSKIADNMIVEHVPLEEQVKHFLRLIPKLLVWGISIGVVVGLIWQGFLYLYVQVSDVLGIIFALFIMGILYLLNRTEKTSFEQIHMHYSDVEWLEIASSIIQPLTNLEMETLCEYGTTSGNYYFYSIEDLRICNDTDLRALRSKIEKKLVYVYGVQLKYIKQKLKTDMPVVQVYSNGIFVLPKSLLC